MKVNVRKADNLMYRVVEIAKMLDKSKTSIYNKLNNNQDLFKGHLKQVEGVKTLDDEGLKILKGLFELKEVESEVESNQPQNSNTANSIEVERLVSELKERINYLEEINRSQNKQLENYQVLLLNEQNRNNLIEEVEAKPTLWDRLKDRFK